MTNRLSVAPSARRLTNSLRDIGYSFESAIADLIDNSIAAHATTVDIEIVFKGRNSYISLTDNGEGMSSETLNEAMRFGSRRSYDIGELGRYGLGLKTASLSQCRRIEVVTSRENEPIQARALDLNFIEVVDDWLITDISDEPEIIQHAGTYLPHTGTSVFWKSLDRLLPAKAPEGGWARRRIESLPVKLESYLAMVFHRFLSGETENNLVITINGKPVDAWDPFARSELATQELGSDEFEIEHKSGVGKVQLRRYLLPTRDNFSTSQAYDSLSGIDKWNKQQGLYIYRSNRLVQWSGWAGIRTIDEHTKYARASLDFDTDLDSAFNINVAKMRVTVPSELRKMLSRPINELCIQADAEYRRSELAKTSSGEHDQDSSPSFGGRKEDGATIGLTLRAAAARTGHLEALDEMMKLIKSEIPDLAEHLGFD
ncbi:ATP-binding protein [Corynebacterium lubricantis]|uniref:ATP-binding protein n=1 Tax=Corynebacterium lubricantis TaxID=541095 RepID=UPI000375A71D|nr:ATP-binding protein [Corynebacterium lubricantis]